MFETSHPADDARMQALLQMLRLIGFDKDAELIQTAWQEFLKIKSFRPSPEYGQCYSASLITSAVTCAKDGIQDIGVKLAGTACSTPVRDLLNEAWLCFWKNPCGYQVWESQQVDNLRKQ